MRNQEPEPVGFERLEVTAAAVVEQVVHERAVWTLLEACLEGLEDCDHLAGLKKMALNEHCQQILDRLGI